MSHVEIPENVEVLCVSILVMFVSEVCGTSAPLAADMSHVDSRFSPGFGAAALQDSSDRGPQLNLSTYIEYGPRCVSMLRDDGCGRWPIRW